MKIASIILLCFSVLASPAHAKVYLNAEDVVSSISKIMSPVRPTAWYTGKTDKGEDCRMSMTFNNEDKSVIVSYKSSVDAVDLKLKTDGMVEQLYVSDSITFFIWDDLLNWGLFVGNVDGATLLGVSRGNKYYGCLKPN